MAGRALFGNAKLPRYMESSFPDVPWDWEAKIKDGHKKNDGTDDVPDFSLLRSPGSETRAKFSFLRVLSSDF